MATAEVRKLADQIRKEFRKGASFALVVTEAGRKARMGDLPREVDAACYGIGWAIETGRLDGKLDQALRSLSLRETAALIAAVAAKCPTIGDVPAWLIANRDAIEA